MSQEVMSRQASTELSDGASIADRVSFSMRNLPLLSQGAKMKLLGSGENLWAHAKLYSSGGENALHMHPIEDHCFFVLQGEATFHFGDGSSFVAITNQGVVLPKKTYYRFAATSGETNLVMLRVGGGQLAQPGGEIDPRYGMPKEVTMARHGTDGKYLDGKDERNGKVHTQVPEIAPGKFFAPD